MTTPFDSIIFDFDSTLIRAESLDILGKMKGVEVVVSDLTRRSMDGEIPLELVMPQKMDLMAPSQNDIALLREQCRTLFVTHVPELFTILRSLGKNIFILSSNFHEVIDPLAKELSVTAAHIFANNIFFHDDGSYRGIDVDHLLCKENGKRRIAEREHERFGRAIYVGDSVADMECGRALDAFIGFGGVVERAKVRAEASCYITDSSALAFLRHMLTTKELDQVRNLTTTTGP